jgi:hypothetical protein
VLVADTIIVMLTIRANPDIGPAWPINWRNDHFARHLWYTKNTLAAVGAEKPNGDRMFVSGETLFVGPDVGTVQTALIPPCVR